jgi:hypothetical protein
MRPLDHIKGIKGELARLASLLTARDLDRGEMRLLIAVALEVCDLAAGLEQRIHSLESPPENDALKVEIMGLEARLRQLERAERHSL